jgi:hypothetical protein
MVHVAGVACLTWFVCVSALPAQRPRGMEIDQFLRSAPIVSSRALRPGAIQITLDDGNRKHDAQALTVHNGDPAERELYILDVAAYELDKALDLNMVVPSVARAVNSQPSAVSWWVEDLAMSEVERRSKQIQPPDPDRWARQMQSVRVFDELISNMYRDISPSFYLSTVWDNLLITKDWKIVLIDHTHSFLTTKQLKHPESLMQCDRVLLGKLRELNLAGFKQKLGAYLAPMQLEALEARRELLVQHFDELIARNGESAVLYDLLK